MQIQFGCRTLFGNAGESRKPVGSRKFVQLKADDAEGIRRALEAGDTISIEIPQPTAEERTAIQERLGQLLNQAFQGLDPGGDRLILATSNAAAGMPNPATEALLRRFSDKVLFQPLSPEKLEELRAARAKNRKR